MQAFILTGDTYAQLIEDVRAVVRHELQTHALTPTATPNETGKEPKTARQIATLFGVCVATIWEWTRAGKFSSHKIGGRTYFFEQEVVAALHQQQRTEKKGR